MYGMDWEGWSATSYMIQPGKPTDAVVGWVSNGAVTINVYKLTEYTIPNISPDLEITDTYGSEINGVTTIFFTRTIDAGSQPIRDSLTNLIGAYSQENLDELVYHGISHSSYDDTLQANFYTGITKTNYAHSLLGLHDIHAIIMFISWGIILPFGALWARYTRHLPHELWIKVHRIFQYGGFLISLSGIILAYVMLGTTYHFRMMTHAVIGTVILGLSCFQVLIAFFRPHIVPDKPKTRNRKLFEIIHPWNGRVLVVLGVVQIYFGIFAIGYNKSHEWVLWTFTVVVGITLLIVGILEIKRIIQDIQTNNNEEEMTKK